MRFGPLFIAVCMVVIAVSAGAAGHFALGFAAAEASIVAIAALTGLALYNALSTRGDIRSQVGPQLGELSRSSADLARQLAELGRRLAAVEAKVDRSLAKSQAVAEPLTAEISELGALVKELADTVALHEAVLTDISLVDAPTPAPQAALSQAATFQPEPTQAPRGRPQRAVAGIGPTNTLVSVRAPPAGAHADPPMAAAARSVAADLPAPLPAVPAAPAALGAGTPAPSMPSPAVPAAAAAASRAPAEPVLDPELQATIRSAIASNRIDLHLQPIVTLPQRKVRYYEAMSRLRTETGEILLAGRFVSQAEVGGLMPHIDNMMVFRCVQVLRRLLLKNREVGVFCNLSTATLTDAAVFPPLLDFLEANRAIAPSLVLELTQAGLRNAGPIESESMAALSERGFRFSLDNVTDLRLEPRDLVSRGFRFVKIPANFLLQRGGPPSDIHPADLSDLLGRFGIELIAEKIESESSVVDLLDFDVKLGQGFLFSPPRPVRAEALQGVGERGDVVVRDTTADPLGTLPTAGAGARATPAPLPNAPRTGGIAQIARRV